MPYLTPQTTRECGMDIDKLIKAVQSGGNNGGSDDKKNTLTDQQQADQLRALLANYVNPPPFKPGDYVRYRSEFADYIRNHDRLHIVLERLPVPYKPEIGHDDMGSNIAYRQYDLVVGVTNVRNHGGVLCYLVDSR